VRRGASSEHADADRISNPEIKSFLKDPSRQEMSFKGNKESRKHVHRLLEGLDVSHVTGGNNTMVIRKLYSQNRFDGDQHRREKETLGWLKAELDKLDKLRSAPEGGHESKERGTPGAGEEDESCLPLSKRARLF